MKIVTLAGESGFVAESNISLLAMELREQHFRHVVGELSVRDHTCQSVPGSFLDSSKRGIVHRMPCRFRVIDGVF